jgi:hypothetical protein
MNAVHLPRPLHPEGPAEENVRSTRRCVFRGSSFSTEVLSDRASARNTGGVARYARYTVWRPMRARLDYLHLPLTADARTKILTR